VSRAPLWRRYALEIIGFLRFVPTARAAALERLRRTSPQAFLRDLPMLLRIGLDEYRRTRIGARLLRQPDGIVPPAPLAPYDAWLAVNRWTASARDELAHRLSACAATLPKISVVMPVYNPPVEFLDAAIRSVLAQVYENWELCIADDASTIATVQQSLQRWQRADPRIAVTFRAENGHISHASNSAAALATGDFLVFLDHDDELSPDALGEVALFAAAQPDADFIYSDSDKIDTYGHRYDPEFKPDWSPELLLSYKYFTHLCAVRRSLFDAVGGFRPGFEGSQDHDLALRATEKARQVGHIKQVLYHWRATTGSIATTATAKPAAFAAGQRAVQEAFARRGLAAEVERPDWAVAGSLGIFAADFSDDGPSVAILIPTRNRLATLRPCLESLRRTTYRNYRIVIIDNESDDPETLEFLRGCGHRVLRVATGGTFNFARLNNQAVQATDAEYVLFLNNDTEVIEPRWLSRMMGYAQLPGVGAVGGRLLYPDGRIQHAGIVHGLHHGLAGHAFKLMASWETGYLCHAKLTRNYLAVTAACMVTPRRLFLDLGGLDETTFGVAYNDSDYCYRLIENGYRCVYTAGAELVHHEGSSRGFVDNPHEVAAYRVRFRDRIDPWYSPHLSLDDELFRIAPRRLARAPLRRIRTCVFSHFLNYTGAPLIQWEVAEALTAQGVIEPVVACVSDGPLRERYERIAAEIRILGEHPLAPVLGRPETYDEAMEALGHTMRDEWKVELVYANTLDTVFAVDAASRVGIPIVWNIHESDGWEQNFYRYGPRLARRCVEAFAKPYRVVFGCDATRGEYRFWNTAHNFTTIRNPLDLSALEAAAAALPQAAARRALGIADDDLVVLIVGTVCERKGQIDVVHALPQLPAALRARVRCFIVGDRPSDYSNAVAAAIAALGDGLSARVVTVPETPDVVLYYRAADVFVCASRMECYPRVTQEAMALGLPMVTTPVFGIFEQVRHGINGLFYEPGRPDQLAEALTRLLVDDRLRQWMGSNAPVVLRGLNGFDETIARYAEILREAYLAAQ
jgi:GT2 family glycosyltransferase